MTGSEQMSLFILILIYVFPIALSMWVAILSLLFTHYSYVKLTGEVKKKDKRAMRFGHVVVGVFALVASLAFATGVFFSIMLFRVLTV